MRSRVRTRICCSRRQPTRRSRSRICSCGRPRRTKSAGNRTMRAGVATVDVREAILDAANRLLARYGYRKMTVDDLAADAGIGKGSVYLHFSSKEDVVISHVDRIVDRLCLRMEQIAARDEPAAARLKAMLIERVLFRLKAVQHYTEALNDVAAAIRPKLLER